MDRDCSSIEVSLSRGERLLWAPTPSPGWNVPGDDLPIKRLQWLCFALHRTSKASATPLSQMDAVKYFAKSGWGLTATDFLVNPFVSLRLPIYLSSPSSWRRHLRNSASRCSPRDNSSSGAGFCEKHVSPEFYPLKSLSFTWCLPATCDKVSPACVCQRSPL